MQQKGAPTNCSQDSFSSYIPRLFYHLSFFTIHTKKYERKKRHSKAELFEAFHYSYIINEIIFTYMKQKASQGAGSLTKIPSPPLPLLKKQKQKKES